ncbi:MULTISPECIES: DUF1570 domain-containing protein [unclassified Sphingomonas]|uniref:DUF1570 domain-containing protein n=1 Tax=unclassified Sphingomonas TaxID=196159 RepID=UPI000BC66AB2|nr:MAG: hypothetical protein B7Y98_05710 [Sphingomonas sp. 32-62-10]
MTRFFAKLLVLLASVALPAAAHAEWLEASHKRFLIYADMSPSALKDFATQLERFDSAMRFLFPNPRDEAESANRVTIYVVNNEDAVQSLARDRSGQVVGFYRPSATGSLIVTPQSVAAGNREFNSKLVLFHEYAHHVTLSNNENYYPGWVTEGLAEFFATAIIRPDGSIMIGGANNARIEQIQANNPMAARALLSSDERALDDIETIQKYARGWLLTHYLMLGKTRPGQFNAYIKLVNQGVPSLAAAEQIFGDLTKLDRELGAYRNQRSLAAAAIPPGKLPADPVTIKPLDAGQAAMMPFRLRSAVGVDTKTAQTLVPKARAVGNAYPANSWVQRALAEIEYDANNDDAALAACDRALAADPKNLMALVYKGMVAMRRAAAAKATDPAVWREARRWYLKANAIDPNFALPFVLYYESFGRAGERPNASAVQGLVRAMDLVPQDNGLRQTVAIQLLVQGDRPGARRALAPVAFNPHGGPANRALAMLKLLDSGATNDAVLAAAKPPKPETPPSKQ